jgi:hypothetical protein
VPDGDIFIHAGDFTMFSESMEAVADFNDGSENCHIGTKSSCREIMSSFWKRTHPTVSCWTRPLF